MEGLDSLFQIKHICCWYFETPHITDCLLGVWRVFSYFSKVQLTIHKATSPVSALPQHSRTLYCRFFSFRRVIKKSFQFHEGQGLREEFSHRVPENET